MAVVGERGDMRDLELEAGGIAGEAGQQSDLADRLGPARRRVGAVARDIVADSGDVLRAGRGGGQQRDAG